MSAFRALCQFRFRFLVSGVLLISTLFKAVQKPFVWWLTVLDFPTMTDPNRTCPTCGTRDGIPKTVKAVSRTIQLALVCRTCRQAWTVEWPDPSALTTTYYDGPRAAARIHG